MKLEVSFLDDVFTPRVGGVDDGLLVFFGDVVDGFHEGQEVVFVVDVFFPVGGEQDVSFWLQVQFLQDF